MAYNLSFRVRREYFDAIVSGKKDREIRKINAFWARRVVAMERAMNRHEKIVATFVCGKDVHRRRVYGFRTYVDASNALGREPSKQGLEDLGDGPVYAFLLGKVVE